MYLDAKLLQKQIYLQARGPFPLLIPFLPLLTIWCYSKRSGQTWRVPRHHGGQWGGQVQPAEHSPLQGRVHLNIICSLLD